MNITNLIKEGANVQLVINALDLREAFLQWNAEMKQSEPVQKEETYLTANETADKLGVNLSTLWRWHRTGYLKKIKMGNKTRYRKSDVIKLMED